MIKQKRSKVKQAVLPFVLERTYETIPAGRQAGTGRYATAISGQKKEAEMTYKGFKGYMPIVGHLAENGLVIYAEFRPCPTADGRAMSLLQPETWSL